MELDLQPILDLQPLEATTLDLQPVASEETNPNIPQLRAAEPKPAWKRALTAVREQLTPLLGPTEAQVLRDGVTADDGTIQYKPMGSKVDREGFFPALSHPMVALPRMKAPVLTPEQRALIDDPAWRQMDDASPAISPEAASALLNTGAGFAEFAESPLGLMTGGLGKLATLAKSSVTPRVIAGAYAADIASKTPEAARHAGTVSVTGTPQEQMEAYLGLGTSILLPGMLGAHALAPGKSIVTEPLKTQSKPEIFSEFGGEAKANEVATTPGEMSSKTTPPEGVEQSPAQADIVKEESRKTGTDPAVPEFPLQSTVPELPATLHSQIVKLREGKAPAVLFTPQDTVPDWALKDERFDTVPTKDGTVLYDTAAWTKDQITQLVDKGETGTVLGYGTPSKPAQPTGAIVVRDKQGLELRAVLVDDATAPAALKAAQAYAGPEDVVKFETPEQVITKRLDATAPAETEKQRMARESVEAMRALAAEKSKIQSPTPKVEAPAAEAAPTLDVGRRETLDLPPVTDRHLAEARAAVADLRGESTERAPDIIDEIEGQVTSGSIRVPEDMADVVQASRERIAGELHQKPWKRLSSAQRKAIDGELRVSTTEGMAADEALPGLGEKFAGMSVDDFANAILDAGEARLLERKKGDSKEVLQMAQEIARAEQDANEIVSDWDQAAEAALEGLKMDTNGQLHAFGLLPEAWNTLIDIAKLAVRGGRALGEAIDYAIAQIKQRYPGQLTDEAGAREALMREVPTRATGQKIVDSDIISDEAKLAIQEYLYDPRSNRTDQQTADGIVAQFGVDAAISHWRDASAQELPGAVRSKLLGSITRSLAETERTARIAGDTAAQQAAVNRQAALWNEALPRITDTAQQLQAMQGMVAMSPDAQVARARREVESAGDKQVENHKAETDAMRTALDEGRAAGIETVKQDAATNTAAREAVNETIKASAETKSAIIMELAGPWAQSEYIVNHAREAVRAKANELLNKQPRPAGFTPAQHLRRILDDLAARAASIFAGHIQGSEPGVLLVDKLMQRLGVDKPTAVKLATSLSKEWDKQLDQARKNLDTRLANARARQERREREPESNAAVDRAIRKQLRDLNLKLGEAIRQAASDRQRTSEHIADRIVQASGLTGPAADALRVKLKARYDQITAAAQQNALEGISKRSGVKITKKMRAAFDRLVELDRLAPVDGDAFFKAVRAALKLPELTEAQAKELRQLVLDAQAKPEGWQQQRAMSKVLTLVENAKGAAAWHDTAFAVWYAHIFSGIPTHLANVIGNTMKTMEVLGIESLRNPLATGQIIKAFARGVESGGLEAGNILLTGSTEGTRLLKAEAARPLEAKIQKGGWNRVWLPWATVGRLMAAEDVVFFKGHEEVKWQLLARKVARQEGLRGEQLDARVQDLMHGTRAKYDAAKVQAATEGLTSPMDVRRRAHEIIEQKREADMDGSTDQARRFALEHTFNGEPYGAMGAIAEVLNTANRNLVVTRFAIPVVRIVANLANESLNYFPPVGLARVIVPKFRSDIVVRSGGDVDALGFYQARALVGTALFGGLLAAMFSGGDDDDRAIELTGQGPRTKNQKEQLRATGWKPNAIRIGDRWYSYQESQLAIPLAILGNYSDAIKYKGLEQKDTLNRTAYVMQTTLNTILDQRMLSGVGDLMDALKPESGGTADLTRLLARSGSSFVVPNAVRWIDQVFDPAVYEPDDVKGAIYAQTPFARRLNRPALNALGDPVERPSMERFTSAVKPDDLMRVIAAKNAWIPMPKLDARTVGNPALGEAYERPMTPDEYYAWIAESGPQIRARLTENIGTLASMTTEEAQKFVQQVTREERAKTKPSN